MGPLPTSPAVFCCYEFPSQPSRRGCGQQLPGSELQHAHVRGARWGGLGWGLPCDHLSLCSQSERFDMVVFGKHFTFLLIVV